MVGGARLQEGREIQRLGFRRGALASWPATRRSGGRAGRSAPGSPPAPRGGGHRRRPARSRRAAAWRRPGCGFRARPRRRRGPARPGVPTAATRAARASERWRASARRAPASVERGHDAVEFALAGGARGAATGRPAWRASAVSMPRELARPGKLQPGQQRGDRQHQGEQHASAACKAPRPGRPNRGTAT